MACTTCDFQLYLVHSIFWPSLCFNAEFVWINFKENIWFTDSFLKIQKRFEELLICLKYISTKSVQTICWQKNLSLRSCLQHCKECKMKRKCNLYLYFVVYRSSYAENRSFQWCTMIKTCTSNVVRKFIVYLENAIK